MPHAIEAHGLEFAYGGGDFRLRVDDWTVPTGARIALTGPSGCGKSTLLDLVAGIARPTAGRLVVDGLDRATATDAAVRRQRLGGIGFLFQDAPLVAYLGALDNVMLPYTIGGGVLPVDATARGRGQALLDRLGLGAAATRRPQSLSQGERQRVALARALVTRPTLILADEPTSGLDPDRSDDVVSLLSALCVEHGSTLVLVTHDPRLADRMEHRYDVGAWSTSGPTGARGPR